MIKEYKEADDQYGEQFKYRLTPDMLGGQFISIQKYMRKRRRLTSTVKPLTLSDKNKYNRISKSFGAVFITRLAHYIRRNTTSKIINEEVDHD